MAFLHVPLVRTALSSKGGEPVLFAPLLSLSKNPNFWETHTILSLHFSEILKGSFDFLYTIITLHYRF